MISDSTLSKFECALSSDRHFVCDPIKLNSCEHSACKKCLFPDLINLACAICGRGINEKLIKANETSQEITSEFESNLESLFQVLGNQMEGSLNMLNSK